MAADNYCCITHSDVLSYSKRLSTGNWQMRRSLLEESIQKLQAGDMSGLDYIYGQTNRQVFAAALAILHDRQLAEDAMQETYVRFVQSCASYRLGSSPVSYILTVCRNICLNMLKRRSRELSTDYSQHENLGGSYTLEQSLDGSEAVEQLLSGLTDDEREVILLKVYGGLKHREIAAHIKKPLGTVLWIYNKAIKKAKINAMENEADNHE